MHRAEESCAVKCTQQEETSGMNIVKFILCTHIVNKWKLFTFEKNVIEEISRYVKENNYRQDMAKSPFLWMQLLPFNAMWYLCIHL